MGAGDVVVVVVVSVAVAGVVIGVVIGADIGGDMVVVAAVPAGEGFTIVVLLTVGAGDVVVVVGATSVRCSQPARSAALARRQMVFFIVFVGFDPLWTNEESDEAHRPVLPNRMFFNRLCEQLSL